MFEGNGKIAKRFDMEVEAQNEAAYETARRIGQMLKSCYKLKADARSKYEVGMTDTK